MNRGVKTSSLWQYVLSIKNIHSHRPEKTAQWSRAFTALVEGSCYIPITCSSWITTTWNYMMSRGPNAFWGPPRAPAHMWHTHTHTHTFLKEILISKGYWYNLILDSYSLILCQVIIRTKHTEHKILYYHNSTYVRRKYQHINLDY